ncbi:hypothetical protein ZHAS_00020475 [Anopheles sinensis]|uniref:Uncharacterized protein n=1 Tax=Anopheles sinensis TaxID=74873 RepID=A0A084WPK5_ANOSI|nr:hypothetical protein ZHAS_00020475 [Anopheles sinensis]
MERITFTSGWANGCFSVPAQPRAPKNNPLNYLRMCVGEAFASRMVECLPAREDHRLERVNGKRQEIE